MCGVSGYAGLGHLAPEARQDLVEALGWGIDQRGGCASGYVTVSSKDGIRMGKTLGEWSDASGRFIRSAAAGETLMMHARYTTSGESKNIDHAHPWAIKRNGRTKLWGCHNGMLWGTKETAGKNGRPHTVDSKEFLELLADKSVPAIRGLEGYGVITYIRPDGILRTLRISRQSDLVIGAVKGGGLVYASTKDILDLGLEYVGLTLDRIVSADTIGTAYRLSPRRGTAIETTVTNLVVDAYSYSGYGGRWGWGDTYDGPYLPTYRRTDDGRWVRVTEEPSSGSLRVADAIGGDVAPSSDLTGMFTPTDLDEEQREEWEAFWREHPEFFEKN